MFLYTYEFKNYCKAFTYQLKDAILFFLPPIKQHLKRYRCMFCTDRTTIQQFIVKQGYLMHIIPEL